MQKAIDSMWKKALNGNSAQISLTVWIHLYNVPLELYSRTGLSYIASGIGVPLSMDSVIASRKRLEYAKLCIEIGLNDNIHEYVDVLMNDGSITSILVELPWFPPCCKNYRVFGHSDRNYKEHKPAAQITTQVWKKKTLNTSVVPLEGRVELLQKKMQIKDYGADENIPKESCYNHNITYGPSDHIDATASNSAVNSSSNENTITTDTNVAITSDPNVPPLKNTITATDPSVVKKGRGRPQKDNTKTILDGSKNIFAILSASEDSVSPTDLVLKKRVASAGVATLLTELKSKKKDIIKKLRMLIVKVSNVAVILDNKFEHWNSITNYDFADNGRIWIIWKNNLDFSVIHVSSQCISIKGHYLSIPLIITVVYGSNDGILRRQLWQHLSDLGRLYINLPWVLGGDLNVIINSNERSNSSTLGPFLSSDMKELQDAVFDLELSDHPFFGPTFSWSNKQQDSYLARKLDRVIVNPKRYRLFPKSHMEFQAPGISDHCLAITWLTKETLVDHPKPFKFFNLWVQHPKFMNVVRQSWQTPSKGNPMQNLFFKLKRLKTCLKSLNQLFYNDISARAKQKKLELETQQLLSLRAEDSFYKELLVQNELKILEEAKNIFLRQKFKVQWLKDGDKCTKFFHSAVAVKTKRETIRVLVDDNGNRLESFESMTSELIGHFTNLIGSENPEVKVCDQTLLQELFQYSLPSDASNALIKDVTKDEIKEAFFCQGNEKAPGPDGYTPYFFKNTWSIIEEDVVAAITQFFKDFIMLPAFNSTSITLVPKVPNPCKVKDFGPIFPLYSGRNIVNNTLLAQELVKGYSRKTISPRCSLKIDIHKAFDSLHWGFVLAVLNAIDLPPTFIKWVEACFTGARYSISFNGSLIGYFKGAKGLRQGDPISPLLFVLSMNKCEFYTAGISPRQIEEIKRIIGFNQGYLPVRYLGFPLVSRKLSDKDFVALINNIRERLHQWPQRHLSYAGRLELIKTILLSITNFWCRQLILPQSILHTIEQLCSRFFWKGSDKASSGARVSWGKLCLLKS
ncbi:uncharacterized protein LOC120131861 [Hibiscus syriacus]|uniref:uncharacterized protein LOC120131861 n=1 Tax=Hibiscus syriacus TaxID=106335 RepID=UPI0019250208|nr:uncharacterized protein LOC120131861 [Hibiscus syriacus]